MLDFEDRNTSQGTHAMHRERLHEVVRVSLNILGILILVAFMIYVGIELRIAFIRWVMSR